VARYLSADWFFKYLLTSLLSRQPYTVPTTEYLQPIAGVGYKDLINRNHNVAICCGKRTQKDTDLKPLCLSIHGARVRNKEPSLMA
jgi:hypothetical protein